ncbi:tRNA (adenosine(37)-N6)-dimethylallyltransferase MiaA [Flavobacteriaceae bacterium]|nr:tRNA (adenosine(37)-N6)-dimethylallyltransferase MiaA [Flavobacteriaceae bacterium]
MNNTLISIVGPTGIGKTALSLKIANHFQSEIISADSRQFFKEIPIGTAAPTPKELQKIKHHFIHNKSITESYSVGAFEKEAMDCITAIHKQQPIIVMVGGSGLYVNAVINGLDEFPKIDSKIRAQLNLELAENGLKNLQEELKILDSNSYNSIDLNNAHRVIRALEICKGTRLPYSSFLKKNKIKRNFKTINIGLSAERSIVYDRINRRVDLMMEQGLLEEVKSVFKYKNLNALNTVGYKELFQYIEGHCTLDFAVAEIKKNTRRFAKRQMTWFKKQEHTKWFDFEEKHSEIIAYIEKQL